MFESEGNAPCTRKSLHPPTKGGRATTRLLRSVLKRVLKTAVEKVLRRVLRRCLAVGGL